MRAALLIVMVSACAPAPGPAEEPSASAQPEPAGAPWPAAEGFFSRGALVSSDGVEAFSLFGDGTKGVVSMDDMTCQFGTSTGTTTTDEDVIEGSGEVVLDAISGTRSRALVRSGHRVVRLDASLVGWRVTDPSIDQVVTARLLHDGLVALRRLPEGCAVDFWRRTEDGAEPYGGAWVEACDAGALVVDPAEGVAWVLADGQIAEVTAEGAHPLGISAERVAWDAGADALYSSEGSVLSAWERDGTPRWSVETGTVHGLVAVTTLGMAVTRETDGEYGRLVAYDGLSGARLHDVGVTRAEGDLVAAPDGPVVAIRDSATRILSYDLR